MKILFTTALVLLSSIIGVRAADTYVAKLSDFSPPNPSNGDTVTWNGASGPVVGLEFGTDAFESINEAVVASSDGDTVFIATGIYKEGSAISLATATRTFIGDGAGLTIIDGEFSYPAFFLVYGTVIDIQDLTIRNGSSASGGGIMHEGQTLTLNNVHFDGNSATGTGGGGGAIYHNNTITGSTVLITNCLFSFNDAPSKLGGAIYQNGGSVIISNSTFSQNPDTAIHTIDGLLQIVQSTLYGNTPEAVSIDSNSSLTLKNTLLLDDYTAANITSNGANFISLGPVTAGDLSYSNTTALGPSDVIHTNLADNGGPTLSHLPFFGGPSYNNGNNLDAVDASGNSLTNDQRGSGFERIIYGTVDIGAIEQSFIMVSTDVDEDDGTADPGTGAGTSLREAIALANLAPGENLIRFTEGLAGTTNFHEPGNPKTIRLTLGQLTINSNVDIAGPGETSLTISGDADGSGTATTTDVRILHVAASGGENPLIILSDCTLNLGKALPAQSGGAILNSGARLYLNRCVFTNNTAENGGAIQNEYFTSIDQCTFEGNGAAGQGGGVNAFSAENFYIFNSTFSNNTANDGGAIHIELPSSAAFIENSTFSANVAATGGALHLTSGSAILRQCTVALNKVTNTSAGGGIFVAAGSPFTLLNTIVGGNESIAGAPAANDIEGTVTGQFSLVSDAVTSGGLYDGVSGNIIGNGGTGTLATGSILLPLADNGGPAATHALSTSSIAVDKGSNALAVNSFNAPLTNDQRGNGFSRIINGTVDIGAFEFQMNTPPVITLNGNNPVYIECNQDTFSDPGATALDSSGGDISGDIVIGGDTVSESTPGLYTVTYNVNDAVGTAADEVTRDVVVEDTLPPVITLTGDDPQLIDFGDAYVEQGATAFDVCEGDVSGLMVIDASAVNPALSGTYPVTYDVADSLGNAAVQVIRLVTIRNSPPVLNTIGDQSIDEVQELTFTAYATIPGDPSVSPVFRLDAGTSGAVPAGAVINPVNGQFSWTPGEADGGSSFTFDIVVERDDDALLTDQETIVVNVADVNVAPVLDLIGDQTVAEATLLAFTVTASDSDLPADSLIFSLDPASEALGMAIDSVSGGFTWTPTVIQGPATYSVTVTVDDDSNPGLTDSETFTIDVTGNLEASEVTLSASAVEAFFDDDVDFTVNVSASPSVGAQPGGDVTLYLDDGSGSTSLGTVALAGGTATFSGLSFPNIVGVVQIIAQYEGDSVFDVSSAMLGLEVVPYRYTISSVTGNEGNSGTTNFVFNVTRELAPDFIGDTSASYSVVPVDASTNDFGGGSFPSGAVAFTGGQTFGTVTIPVSGDDEYEADEFFDVILEDGIEIVTTSASGGIINDDAHRVSLASGEALHEPESSPGSGSANSEDGGIVLRRNGTFGDLAVIVRIEDSSVAVLGVDYTLTTGGFSGSPLSGTLTIPDGESEISLVVIPIDDLAAEADESITFTIVPQAPYHIDNTTSTAVIAQNDFGVTSLGDFDSSLNPDGGEGTLRQALINAKSELTLAIPDASGPVITFQPGLSGTLFLTEGPLVLDLADFTIEGPGSDVIAVDGGSYERVLLVADEADDRTYSVSGLTFQNGFTSETGGVIYNSETLTLSQCVVTGGFAYNGGGIANEGDMTLLETKVIQNLATVYGGGIDNFGGNLRLTESTVSSNNAEFGGGIENSGAGVLRIDSSTIDRNGAIKSGGGIDSYSATTLISNSTIAKNGAGFGAGLFNEQSQLTVIQSTVAENSAGTSTGGILNSSNAPAGMTLLHNTIVAGNLEAGSPSEISTANSSFVDVRSDSAFNLIGDSATAGGIVRGVNGNQVGHTFSAILAVLGNHGGTTEVYPLAPGSPATDAGNNSRSLTTGAMELAGDQRGATFPRIVGSSVDIGAYESNPGGFAIVSIESNAVAGATVKWNSEPGVLYDVMRSIDLKTWTAVKTGVSASTTLTEWTDAAAPTGEAYFKIRRP